MSSPEKINSTFGPGINVWADKLITNYPDLSERIREDFDYKLKNLELLRKFNLPIFKTIIIDSIESFFYNPDETLLQLRFNRYFASLTEENGSRSRIVGTDRENLINWLNKKINENNTKKMKLLVSECPDQPYNGVLIVGSNGEFLIEMINGPLPDLISNNKTPDFILIKRIGGNFDFTSNQPEILKIREHMLEVVEASGYYPGYYEFTLAKIDQNDNNLTPFFFEFSDRETYQLPT